MSEELWLQISVMLFIALAIELLTTVFRISFHMRSARVQHKLNWPRIHHSYPGIAFVLSYFLVHWPWLWVVGGALIISDLFHHLVAIPVLHWMHYDVCMSRHERAHKALQRIAGIVLLATGLIALVTPLTPGSFLIPIGVLLIGGKKLVRKIFLLVFPPKIYRRLKVEALMERFRVL